MANVKTLKVQVDQRRCGAVGLCVREAPTLFRFQPGSKRATVEGGAAPAHLRRMLRSLAERCPYQAIVIDEGAPTPSREA